MCLVLMLLSFLDVRTTFLFDGLSKSKTQWTAECFEVTGSLTDKLKAVFSPDLVNKIEKVITFVNWDVDIEGV